MIQKLDLHESRYIEENKRSLEARVENRKTKYVIVGSKNKNVINIHNF